MQKSIEDSISKECGYFRLLILPAVYVPFIRERKGARDASANAKGERETMMRFLCVLVQIYWGLRGRCVRCGEKRDFWFSLLCFHCIEGFILERNRRTESTEREG